MGMPLDCVSLLLAVMSEHECSLCLQARSLLTAHVGLHDAAVPCGRGDPAAGLRILGAEAAAIPEAKVEEIKRICLTVDQKAAIFDVPSEYVEVRPMPSAPDDAECCAEITNCISNHVLNQG